MSEVGAAVWLTCAYAGFLLAVAYGLDVMARRAAARATHWTTGSFRYHADHDAWQCPQDQWLWPTSFDPENRVMRYRGSPTVCNACPVKHTCTTSANGREVSRAVDPWPHSEAGRFHRGIACAVTVLAALLPLASMVGRSATEAGVLLVASVAALVASWPLWSHLRKSPAGFPEHVPARTLPVADVTGPPVAGGNRFSTRWGSFSDDDATTGDAGWSRMGRS